MGGFRLEPEQYNLVFEDPKFEGLTVSLSGMSLGEAMEFDLVRFAPATSIKELTDQTRKTAEIIVGHVVDWNLAEADGSPTPKTVEGLLGHDAKVQRAIARAYGKALQGVPEELGKESTNGAEVDSLPMEDLPPNL